MKKFIILIIFIGLFICSYIYQNEIYNIYKEIFTKEEVKMLPTGNKIIKPQKLKLVPYFMKEQKSQEYLKGSDKL